MVNQDAISEVSVENWRKYHEALEHASLLQQYGKITRVVGLVIQAIGLTASVGELCEIHRHRSHKGDEETIPAEVVGFEDEQILLMPLGGIWGIRPMDRVRRSGVPLRIPVGSSLLGRVVDALGQPIDNGPALVLPDSYPVHNIPPNPFLRRRIREPIATGVRAIDALLTCGKGQRVGIFAGSGVGKSTLLGMIARYTSADVNVIALVGERGREVREFVEEELGEEGLRRSVVIVATSDQPPLLRVQGAFTATAIAEYFRDQGHDVLFMMDSVTRFAMAQREIGLAIGEPPTTRGYTPSVFARLPTLLERAGTTEGQGSITGLYTVLVEGDDMNEPIADAARSILDGHIELSRDLASQGHYPAIRVLSSLSRVMDDLITPEHQLAAQRVRQVLADYEQIREAHQLGVYNQGMNPRSDFAIQQVDQIHAFLRQTVADGCKFEDTIEQLIHLLPEEAMI